MNKSLPMQVYKVIRIFSFGDWHTVAEDFHQKSMSVLWKVWQDERKRIDPKPFSINPLVEFYNEFLLKYPIPFGGLDMESGISKNMSLRFSKKGDKFVALDADEPIDAPAREALYVSGNTVITRHINWRQ